MSQDVLDFRKLSEGMFRMSYAPVQLLPLIDAVCRQGRAYFSPLVELSYRVNPADAVAMLDSRRLFQIITNGLRYHFLAIRVFPRRYWGIDALALSGK